MSGQNLGPGGNVTTGHAPVKGFVHGGENGQPLAPTRTERGQRVDRLGVVQRGGVEGESGFLGRGRGRGGQA